MTVKTDFQEQAEELLELEDYSNTYSMTGFAENLYDIEELKAVSDDKKVIVENEGVFSISEDLEIDESKIQVDKDFKALVDSIL